MSRRFNGWVIPAPYGQIQPTEEPAQSALNREAFPLRSREGEGFLYFYSLTGRTLWQRSIEMLVKDGITAFLEIGPGRVLKGLIQRINPELKVYNLGTKEEIMNFGRTA